MTIEQMLLIAAAGAVAFFPQIRDAVGPLLQSVAVPAASPAVHSPSQPSSRPFPSRSSWVSSVLALQDELLAAKRDKAAALAGQLVIEIVNAQAASEGKR